MKTAEDVEKAFSHAYEDSIPFGSLVRVTLQNGLKTVYRRKSLFGHREKKISILPAAGRRARRSLTGTYKEIWGETLDDYATLEFETPSGYKFYVKCYEIADFKVLEKNETEIF